MHVPSQLTVIQRMINSRLKQMAPKGPVLAATLTLVHKRCGQPSCACQHGGPRHPAHHLAFTDAGKLRIVYVPQDLLAEVQQWVQEHHRLKTLVHEVSLLTLALVRNHVTNRKRRRGRP